MLGKCVARWSRASPSSHLAPPTSPAFIVCVLLFYGTFASATRLRHSRYLDVRSQFLSEGELSLDDNYNHKPVFSNCSNYAPVVKEEEPFGIVVIQVYAEDRDPPEEGSTITYSLVTALYEKIKFEINNGGRKHPLMDMHKKNNFLTSNRVGTEINHPLKVNSFFQFSYIAHSHVTSVV